MVLGSYIKNCNLKTDIIEENISKSWNWNHISYNPNLTMEFIEKYIDKPFGEVYLIIQITMEFIEKYPDKPWRWYCISYNSNITMEFIEKHPDKPWDYDDILRIQILLWIL